MEIQSDLSLVHTRIHERRENKRIILLERGVILPVDVGPAAAWEDSPRFRPVDRSLPARSRL
jgi:hypothetical protein